MTVDRFSRLILPLACAALLGGAIAPAVGQTAYPTKPVRVIVPLPPGGGADLVARLVGRKLGEMWGQPVLVENRPGASMMIGEEMVAKAQPDGYTLAMTASGHTMNPSLFPQMPYNPARDLTAVSLVGEAPLVLVVHPSVPAATVQELIALAGSRRDKLNFASAGNASAPHLAAELFKQMAKVDMTHVPYKGSGPAEADLVGGHVDLLFAGLVTAGPQIKAGKMRALAVTSLKRSSAFPDLPALSEVLPGYQASVWWGMLAPAQTPRAIVNKLYADIAKVLQDPEVRSRIVTAGGEAIGSTPEQFGKLVEEEIGKWKELVRSANIKTN